MTQNKIDIVIESIFQSSGVRAAENSLNTLNRKLKARSLALEQSLAKRGGFNIADQLFRDLPSKTDKTRKSFDQLFSEASPKKMETEVLNKDFKEVMRTGNMMSSSLQKNTGNIYNGFTNIDSFMKRHLQKDLDNFLNRVPSFGRAFKKSAMLGTSRLQQLRFGLQGVAQQFNMANLSVLFFGMAIKQVFTNIIRQGLATFMDIVDASNQTAQSINRLRAGLKVLQFTIGEAIAKYLEPYIPLILKIVDATIDWIDRNQELVGKIVIWGAIIGGLLFAFAQLALGIRGLVGLLAMIFNATTLTILGFIAFMIWTGKLAKDRNPEMFEKVMTDAFDNIKNAGSEVVNGIVTLLKTIESLGQTGVDGAEDMDYLVAAFFYLTDVISTSIRAIGGFIGYLLDLFSYAVLGLKWISLESQKLKSKTSLGGLLMSDAEKKQIDNQLNDLSDEFARVDKSFMNHIEFLGEATDSTKRLGRGYSGYVKDVVDARKESEKLEQINLMPETDKNLFYQASPLSLLQTPQLDLSQDTKNVGLLWEDVNTQLTKTKQTVGETNQEFTDFYTTLNTGIPYTSNQQLDLFMKDIETANENLKNTQTEIGKIDFNRVDTSPAVEQIEKLNTVLSTTSEENNGNDTSLTSSLSTITSTITGDGGLNAAIDLLKTKITDVADTIQNIFVLQINNATAALNNNAVAANSAANAQERYNRAVQGATG